MLCELRWDEVEAEITTAFYFLVLKQVMTRVNLESSSSFSLFYQALISDQAIDTVQVFTAVSIKS